ncbi:MAG: hypothetical protein ABR961_16670 [Thermoanaerobaculaceae bacterium]|jgi:hypothetical protein
MNPIKNLGGVVKWCMAMVPLAAQTPGPRVTPINETGSATGKIVRVQPFFDSTPPFVEFTLPAADLYRVSNFYFVSEKTEAIKSVYAALLTAVNNEKLVVVATWAKNPVVAPPPVPGPLRLVVPRPHHVDPLSLGPEL